MLQPALNSVLATYDFHLILSYVTGEVKSFDVRPYIRGSFYGQLADPNYFNKVRLSNNGHGIEWPNGQDLAPHELYELSKSVKIKNIKL